MKPEYPYYPKPEQADSLNAPSSRFLDEKISDDDSTETKTDSALKPAGLSNPFWK